MPFAAPGGHIFVFSGLIEAMDNIDELAAVICHEIGHISARHLSKRIEQSKNIGIATLAGILAAMLVGGEAAAPIISGTLAAGMQARLYFSREDERLGRPAQLQVYGACELSSRRNDQGS